MKSAKKTPLWLSIADTLRSELGDGVYIPGDKLPTEAELSRRFGVNRHTVRHAIAALVEEDLLRTRRGAGVFVIGALPEDSLSRKIRFHQNILSGGPTSDQDILQIETRASSRREASLLDLKPGADLYVCHGLARANNMPIALFSSHFPAARVPGLAQSLTKMRDVTGALKASGVSGYKRASFRIGARQATSAQVLHLHVREGAPLVFVTSLNVDADQVPVEFVKTWYVADRVTLTLDEDNHPPQG